MRLDRPIAVRRGDRCIVRIASPSLTIGGGRIVDAHPRRHRRFRAEVLERLETLARGTPAELLAQAAGDEVVEWSSLQRTAGLAPVEARQALQEALSSGLLLRPSSDESGMAAVADDTLLLTTTAWARLRGQIETTITSHHQRQSLTYSACRVKNLKAD